MTRQVSESELPGFIDITEASSPSSTSSPPNTPQHHFPRTQRVSEDRERPGDSNHIRNIWNNVSTPKLQLRTIQQYQDYIQYRIQASTLSQLPLTPSVSHVFEKARKATHTLSLNGITATAEMRRLKEKNLLRYSNQARTSIVGKYGPLRVGDARIRIAKDEYNRRAAQEDEERRLQKKYIQDEVLFLRRWLRNVRAKTRTSITLLKLSDIYTKRNTVWREYLNWPYEGRITKATYRALLDSNEWLSQRYHLHRQLRLYTDSRPKVMLLEWEEPPMMWPEDYDEENITNAMQFVILDAQERAASRLMLSYEVDGIEIIGEDTVDGVEFGIETIKGEEIEDTIVCA